MKLSKYCVGERCGMCYREGNTEVQAYHKIGEVIFDDNRKPFRHPFTQYVCTKHFKQIMGRG